METELTLALPTTDPLGLERRLAQIPVLARAKAARQEPHDNTPEAAPSQRLVAWVVRQRDGSRVNVALSLNHTVVDDKNTTPCALELTLLGGEPAALFAVARQLAKAIAVLPLYAGTAGRSHALAHNAPHLPQRAQPPTLAADLPLPAARIRVLREMFSQFTSNLNALLVSDDPEVVHQARIGWRRFKSGLKLFRHIPARGLPAGLRPLLSALGALRDLEVASLETLPMLANAYAAGDRARQAHWRAMDQALAQAADQQRHAVRGVLCEPGVGAALVAIGTWLDGDLAETERRGTQADPDDTLKSWARQRIKRLHAQLGAALDDADDAESLHRVRILAKRLRYGIESLRVLLPKRRTQHWYLQAIRLQNDMGAARDVHQALAIVGRLDIDHGLVDFLRGVATGQKRPP